MKGVLDDMKRLKVELVEGNFFIFIESYAKFELYNEIIKVLDMIRSEFCVKPGTFSYHLLLNVLVDGNKFKFVENVHSRMLGEGVKAVKGTPVGCKVRKSCSLLPINFPRPSINLTHKGSYGRENYLTKEI
uniref:Uncharacterized protein n=1 Tax=Solanum lycopersicum TaxID=4081 RepID=A0A3Q7J9L3_SOLLC